jgi:hypothetical protein
MNVGRSGAGGPGERPWWDESLDEYVISPPSQIVVLKSTKSYSWIQNRIHDLSDPGFLGIIKETGYVLMDDVMPLDMRLYFFHHATKVICSFGSGLGLLSHLLGADSGILFSRAGTTLDVIVLVHPQYDNELRGMVPNAFAQRGFDLKLRTFVEGGVECVIHPPNNTLFGVTNAYVKTVRLPNMTDLRKEHVIISDEQRRLADNPAIQCSRQLKEDKIFRQGVPTGYEMQWGLG